MERIHSEFRSKNFFLLKKVVFFFFFPVFQFSCVSNIQTREPAHQLLQLRITDEFRQPNDMSTIGRSTGWFCKTFTKIADNG